MNIYQQRWNNVFKFASKVKELFDTTNYIIQLDGVYLNGSDIKVIIDDDKQYFAIWCTYSNVTRQYLLYDGTPGWDHGRYTPTRNMITNLRDRVKLYQLTPTNI